MDVDYIWNAIPKNVDEIITVINWAAGKGWTVRARGGNFSWYPGLVCDLKASNQKLLLVNMIPHIGFVDAPNKAEMTVRCGGGAKIIDIINVLDKDGLVLSSYPADGDLTIGGIVTAGSHGSVCTDAPDIGPNPHGSLANMVTQYDAIVYDDVSKQYITRTFDRSSAAGRAFLITFGRIIITSVTVRVMKNYNCRCQTTVAKDFDQVFQKPSEGNPRPDGSFAQLALSSGRYSALSMPLINTVWHRNVSVCETKPSDPKVHEITAPYSFPYMANVPLWQQALAEKSMGVPREGLLSLLAEHFGPDSHEGIAEKVANEIGDVSQRFQNAFGITDLLQRTSKSTSYITKATVELSDWFHNLSDTWGKSQNILLCVINTLRMRSFGVVIHTSRDRLQHTVAAAMAIVQTTLNDEAKNGNYPVALPVEFRASSLDDDVESGSPSLSFIRKDKVATDNGWDIAVAIEVVHFPKTYGVNSYMTKLETALAHCSDLSGTNARVVANWGKSYAYSAAGSWHSQRRLDEIRAGIEDWDAVVELINKADPANVTNNSISRYVLAKKGAGALENEKTVNVPLPWDTKWGEEEPGCCKSCVRFWCCCCTE